MQKCKTPSLNNNNLSEDLCFLRYVSIELLKFQQQILVDFVLLIQVRSDIPKTNYVYI